MAIDCSANNLRIYCHNIQGLRGEEKLEWIARLMEHIKSDAYIIQETHLEGDFIKYISGDKLLIHHSPIKQPITRANGRLEKRRLHNQERWNHGRANNETTQSGH